MHKCDFCGREQTEVIRMISGNGVDIYDKCVLLCMKALTEEILNGFERINLKDKVGE